jgi:hypothetical protein
MTSAYFQHLPAQVCAYLLKAQNRIRIAVCWFTHSNIFDVLLSQLRRGIDIELLIEYDHRNIRQDGLDFQRFIQSGGQLFAYRNQGLMHHKFAIIDDRLLLSGSFNWTVNYNADNLVATDDPNAVGLFHQEFQHLIKGARRITQVKVSDAKAFRESALFENNSFRLPHLRKLVSGGASIWLVQTDKILLDSGYNFEDNCLPFDTEGRLSDFWKNCRIWDAGQFDQELVRLKRLYHARVIRDLRVWARRVKTGDLVLARQSQNLVTAIGIVRSCPMHSEVAPYCSYREIQWLKTFSETPLSIEREGTGYQINRLRCSGLKILEDIFRIQK